MLEKQVLNYLAKKANSNASAVSEPWLKEHWQGIAMGYRELAQIRTKKLPGRQPERFRHRRRPEKN
jgi:hypothetical protein